MVSADIRLFLVARRSVGRVALAVIVVGATIGIGIVVASITGESLKSATSNTKCASRTIAWGNLVFSTDECSSAKYIPIGIVVAVGVGCSTTIITRTVMIPL